ncbi:hypothetical protein AB0I60_14615 [Actinosynnema sp. NPDC050436]|uniref:hypothetical protein n=1 Tax=Actinosynnema sp. NPDC050436 TaxID=3155659 RepID=UPI0033D2F24A
MDGLPEARAVLVGVARCASLPDVPAAHHSVQALRGALVAAGAQVDVVEDPKRGTEVCWLLRDAERTLLLYYAGHARLAADGGLLLALAGSDPADPGTWLPFAELRRSVEQVAVPDKLVVLDLCFADAAQWADSAADLAARVEPVAGVVGARTLVHCLASREAIYDARAGGMTYVADAFTRKLHAPAGGRRDAPPAAVADPPDDAVPEPVQYRVSAPRAVRVADHLAVAAAAAVAGGLAWAVGSTAWSVALTAVIGWVLVSSEAHVVWWSRADVGRDGLVLHRGRSPAALLKRGFARRLTTGWDPVERVLVGRAGGRTRVTLHISTEAASRVWDSAPYTGTGGYRYGVLAGRDRGFAWSLGDLDAPADEVGEVFRAAVPPEVDVVVLTAELPFHRARRWALVSYLVLFGGPLVGLALAG